VTNDNTDSPELVIWNQQVDSELSECSISLPGKNQETVFTKGRRFLNAAVTAR
jgi:hypothetical protein